MISLEVCKMAKRKKAKKRGGLAPDTGPGGGLTEALKDVPPPKSQTPVADSQ